MAQSEKEADFIRRMEALMGSTDVQALQDGIVKLLSAYQKQARRFEKVIKQSDRQQEYVFAINNELERIKEEQAQSIDNLITDKKKRAKNVMETKKRIYELHREEMHKAKSEVDQLTQILVQKEQTENELQELKTAYRELKKRYSESSSTKNDTQNHSANMDDFDLQAILKELIEKHQYEQRLQKMFKTAVAELELGKVDNLKFKKFFVALIMQKIREDLESLKQTEHLDMLKSFVLRKYFDDAIYFFADHLIQQTAKKNIEASHFINFYNGEVAFLPNGQRINKPEVSDLDGNRWTSSSIMQVALRRNQEVKVHREKKQEVLDVQEHLNKKRSEFDRLTKKYETLKEDFAQVERELSVISTDLSQMKKSWMQRKQERLKASGSSAQTLDEEIKNMGATVQDLESSEYEFVQQRKQLSEETEKIEIQMNQLNKEIKGYETMLDAESRKLGILQQSLQPLEEKYQLIVSALARTIIRFQV